MIDHDLDGRTRACVLPQLLEHSFRVRRVVNHPKGINQVIRLDGNESAELLGIARAETDTVLESEYGGACAGELHGFVGEVHSGDLSASTGKVDGVRADAASDFQDPFAAPALELGERGNVRLNEVFASFDLVEIFPGADDSRRVADVAGTGVPVIADAGDFDVDEGHRESIKECV